MTNPPVYVVVLPQEDSGRGQIFVLLVGLPTAVLWFALVAA